MRDGMDSFSSGLNQLELNRPLGFLLRHHGAIPDTATGDDVGGCPPQGR
jgi:hypothetical protein